MAKKIVKPYVDELNARYSKPLPTPQLPAQPQPAELDQDAGGGYNTDHTYPQT